MLGSLLEKIKSQESATVKAAVEEARALPPEQLLELLKLVEQTHQPTPTRGKSRSLLFALLLCSGLLLAFGSYAQTPPSLRPLCLTVGFLVGGYALYSLCRGAVRMPLTGLTSRIPVMLLLEGCEDPRFLGPLLNQLAEFPILFREEEAPLQLTPVSALGITQNAGTVMPVFSGMRQKTLRLFTEGLNRMLTKAGPEHFAALNSHQKRALLLPLNVPSFDVELTLRILKALEQIGDNDALPVVERLARGKFYLFGTDETASPDEEQIRQTARKCLPHILHNLKEAMQAASLLRPSEVGPSPETLLRPATSRSTAEPASQLLRPIRTDAMSGEIDNANS